VKDSGAEITWGMSTRIEKMCKRGRLGERRGGGGDRQKE